MPTRDRRDRRMIVVFDLMQTLVTDPYRAAHEAATGLSWAEFEARRPDGVYHSLERGEIAESEYWQALRDAGIVVDVERFHRTRRAGYRWLPGMRELLAECAGHGPVVVASNYPVWIDDVQAPAFAAQGVRVHASCRLGVRKPDISFFVALAEREGVSVGDLVLVDDAPVNVEGIERAGGAGVTMTGAGPVRDRLVRLGALPNNPLHPAMRPS
jgi:HAD superfamily hydrolase (TIGR01509 family)